MVGSYKIRIRNNRNTCSFELKRNITILKGKSGIGKTTLYEMVRDYNRFGKNSGVSVSCEKNIYAVEGSDWKRFIENHPDSIIVLDEDSDFIRSNDFARTVKSSDNYFLLITRNYLPNLPISVDEVYELTGNKNNKFVNSYSEIDRIFDNPDKAKLPFVPEVIITEDTNSGFQFFKSVSEKAGIECVSAGGKSGIYRLLNSYPSKNVVIIADGAAFGAEIESIVMKQKLRPNKIAIFLPESFEWIILKSGVIKEVDMARVDNAELYADSAAYMSWEQYFTKMLEDLTKDSRYMKYSKNKLNDFYLQEKNMESIKTIIKGVTL